MQRGEQMRACGERRTGPEVQANVLGLKAWPPLPGMAFFLPQ